MLFGKSGYSHEFSSEPPRLLFEEPYALDRFSTGNPNYDVAADGRFLMVRTEGPAGDDGPLSQVTVVLNWTQELLERVPVD